MTSPTPTRRLAHWFTGTAVGAVANIRRENDRIITDDRERFLQSHAVAAIGTIGGFSHTEAENIQFKDGLITIQRLVSEVRGDFQTPKAAAKFTRGNFEDNQLPAVTTISCSGSGYSIRNGGRTVEIASASFEMTSVQKVGVPGSPFRLSVSVDGLKIDGKALKVKIAGRDLTAIDSFEDCLERSRDKGFVQKFGHYFFRGGERMETPKDPPRSLPASSGQFYFTVVDSIKWENPKEAPAGVTPIGRNRLKIDGLGTLALGEVRIVPNSKKVSVIKLLLGSPYGGELESVSGDGNGGGWPP